MGSFTYGELEQAISPGRASRYLGSTVSLVTGRPDPRAAVQLYERNVEISAAAWVVISDIEIVLRNIVADSMTAHHAATRTSVNYRWYDDPTWFATGQKWFTSETLRSIATAMGRVGDPGPTGAPRPPEGRVVAELTLGFWRYLLVSRYEHSLWNPSIRSSFHGLSHLSGSDSRKAVYSAVERLNYLRNRVAHHEPIYEPFTIPGHPGGPIDARLTLTNAIEMVSWANPAAAQWIERRSTLTRAGRWRHLGHSARGIARPSL